MGGNQQPGSQYRIRLTDNSNSTLVSTSSAFTIGSGPAITTHPVSQTLCPGQSASFSVAATGGGNTYQWFKAGQMISGATTSTYTIPGITAANAGRYYVVVSNACGTPVTSEEAILTVGDQTMIQTLRLLPRLFVQGSQLRFPLQPQGPT